MTNQLEMVNGVLQPMSDADQTAYNARQAAWPATQAAAQALAALPNVNTQLALIVSTLITKGVILNTDIPASTLTAVNNTLTTAGHATIAVPQ